MDSLLANYVSSDEEEEEEEAKPAAFPSKPTSEHTQPKPSSSKFSSLFSSLPPVKQEPSLPNPRPPKPTSQISQTTPKPSSIFSSLPQVKSEVQHQPISITSSSDPKPKRVVQFQPPISRSSIKSFDSDDSDDDREEKELKQRKQLEISAQNSSVESFLSSIPAPKSSGTLGVLPSSGSGRRAVVDTDAPVSNAGSLRGENESGIDHNIGNYTANFANYDSGDQNVGSYSVNYESYANYDLGTDQNANVDDQSQYVMSSSGSGSLSYGEYGRYASYGDCGQHGSNLADGSTTAVPELSGLGGSGVRVGGKRGRNEVPVEIVEVNQDELMKNRPREDQVKLTGIAFGPSYQPVSTKGKPTKLHKRKHQIGSLFFDMKQKEMELAERRSRGFLTKAETQAKYGW